MTGTDLAGRLASWSAAWPGHIAPDTVGRARDALVDVLGVIVAGRADAAPRAVAAAVGRFGTGPCFAVTGAARLPAPWAALVNGTAAHALDFDDSFTPFRGHATAVLAPAIFAVAEEEGLSGARVVDAYVVGLELLARLGLAFNPRHYACGWHATSTIGAIGAAGACARLLRLDATATLAAMSIGFSMAGGSKLQFGTMMKSVHAGLAAQHGILAARMAQAGLRGNAAPLAGKWGFADLYDGAQDAHVDAPQTGETLAIDQYGLSVKRFPCCAAAHRTLDGLVALQAEEAFALADVARVETPLPRVLRDNLRFDRPADEMEARFSLPYCAMRVLQAGQLTLQDLTLPRVREAGVADLLARVVVSTRPAPDSRVDGADVAPIETRIVFASGRVRQVAVRDTKGSGRNPLTQAEVRAKFLDCCAFAGQSAYAGELFERAAGIPDLSHFGAVTDLLAARMTPSD